MHARLINERKLQDAIINSVDVCHVAMVDSDNMPYVVAMNFAYDGEFLYLHSAPEGSKLNCIENNPSVCIAFSTDHLLRYAYEEVACTYSMKYKSVHLYGKVEFVEEFDKKIAILNLMMDKYTGKEFTFSTPAVKNVKVWRVHPTKVAGRRFDV